MLRSTLFTTTLLLAIGALEVRPGTTEAARALKRESRRLDLSRSAIAPSDLSGGPPRDGIPHRRAATPARRRGCAPLRRDEPLITVAGDFAFAFSAFHPRSRIEK